MDYVSIFRLTFYNFTKPPELREASEWRKPSGKFCRAGPAAVKKGAAAATFAGNPADEVPTA
jgi:hypothetical protein